MNVIELANKYIFGVGVPVLLILSGIFYCIRLRAFHFLHPLKVIGCFRADKTRGGVSSAKAVSLALAGTLGVGNMVGVASAIALGGVGAVFWMWVSALVAMILKYAEIVLAMRHRRFDKNGRPYGGATYYILDLFKGGRVGRVLAGIFATLCILNAISVGGMIQVNAAANAVDGVFSLPPLAVGAVFAAIALYAMRRGTGGIVGLTEKIVPFMTVVFVILSVAVICVRPDSAAEAVRSIFANAFRIESGVGGVGGFLLSSALRYGTMRGIISNEAGCGTAPAAHAVADCSSPARQGAWGIFEVFVDTILLCTLTALVIIIGGGSSEDFMMMTISSYTAVLGDYAGYMLSVAVVLFALATVLCWGHYGLESVRFLSGKRRYSVAFIALYTALIALGSVVSPNAIWELADLAIGGMTVINLFVILAMSREVKEETEEYFGKKKQ